MNIHSFAKIVKSPQKITSKDTEAIHTIISEYPYFQTARAVYLKGLKNNESYRYNSELKVTAAHTTDRAVLFNFITSTQFNEVSADKPIALHQQILGKINSGKPSEVKENFTIGEPLTFTKKETHSFNEWLQLGSQKKIDRSSDQKKEIDKTSIIDKFIKQNPKISKVSKTDEKKEILLNEKQDSYLMTETLAKVYLEQNKYENAIKAYKILSLKYPEKSGFFADQIKRIRILQNK